MARFVSNYSPIDFSGWPIFDGVDQEFLKQLKLVQVIDDGNSALMVNSYDEVIGVGMNRNGCLGLGHRNPVRKPQNLFRLSGKSVCGFSCGDKHVVAFTASGSVYAWGKNDYGQVGNHTTNYSIVPERIIVNSTRQVACGSNHTVIVTVDHDVISWGMNSYGQLGIEQKTLFQVFPTRVRFPVGTKVVQVSCGFYHSVALTDAGQVFAWGDNEYQQLGCESYSKTLNAPVKVSATKGYNVVKVACGVYHSLALSDDGQVIMWGLDAISNYQMKRQFKAPAVNIEACYRYYNSVVEADGYIYAWGRANSSRYPVKQNGIRHCLDAFKGQCTPSVVALDFVDPMQLIGSDLAPNERHCSKLFNNKELSDFIIKTDDKKLYAHKVILCRLSKHFQEIIQSLKNPAEMTIPQSSFETFRHLVYYIYHGDVKVDSPNILIALGALAFEFKEDELYELCISKLKTFFTTENAAELYQTIVSKWSPSQKNEVSEIEEALLEFVAQNLDEVALTEGFKKLPAKISSALSSKAIKRKRTSLYSYIY